jgi:hypothetical protein
MNVEDTIVAICDNGQFVSYAERLARDFKKVYYTLGQEDEMPRLNDAMVGDGLGTIEVVDSRDDERLDEAGLWVFPDLGYGHTQIKKEEKEGKLVWGSRLGEEMEQQVEDFKDLLHDVGLPVGPWKSIVGFSALRKHLQKHPDVYVKMSKFRGSWETLYCPTYEQVKGKLDERELRLSGKSEDVRFVVIPKLRDKVELAIDGYCVDGRWPSKVLVGMEKKGECYLGRLMSYKDAPAPLLRVNAALEETLRNYGYRGPLAFETLIGKDGEPYVTDPCCRLSSPCSALQQEFYTNISEIVLRGAAGELIDPVPPEGALWGAEVMIQSEWVNHNWENLRYPDKFERYIKLGEYCRNGDGMIQVIPQGINLNQCGGIIGWSDTPKKAINMVTRIAKEVAGSDDVNIPVGSFDALLASLEQAKSYGLNILD